MTFLCLLWKKLIKESQIQLESVKYLSCNKENLFKLFIKYRESEWELLWYFWNVYNQKAHKHEQWYQTNQ